jgi:hypothetical protein
MAALIWSYDLGEARPSPQLACLDYRPATKYNSLYAALDGHAIEWRPSAPCLKAIVAQAVLGLRIYLNPGVGLGW